MKKKRLYKLIPKGLLTLGFAAGLSLSPGIATAAGQIAVVSNDTDVDSGEEFGATLVLSGDGRYDVYAGVTGGVFGEMIYAFTPTGDFIPVDWIAPPPKLKDNVELSQLSVKERIISLLPKIPLAGYAGSYIIYVGLTTPGQLDFPIFDALEVEVK
jgi:hypothetical protein